MWITLTSERLVLIYRCNIGTYSVNQAYSMAILETEEWVSVWTALLWKPKGSLKRGGRQWKLDYISFLGVCSKGYTITYLPPIKKTSRFTDSYFGLIANIQNALPDGAIFVWPWKMISVSVRYLFYQSMDENIKTWPLRFLAKENPNVEKALFNWPIML